MSTWWIEKPLLLGSSNPLEDELQKLYKKGFRIIISLLDEAKQSPRYDPNRAIALGYTRHHIPIADFQAPSLVQLYEFATLLGSVPRGAKVLVHCEGGSGRTGTMGAAYWIAKGMSAADAIHKVRQVNPHAVETPEQERMLDSFEETVKKTREDALDTFQKLVALLYREIGVLDARNHRELASKRKLGSGFFSTPARKIMSHQLYWKARNHAEPESILRAFEERTGLSLHDVKRAFSEGDWKDSSGGYSYGGPKWNSIAEATIQLQATIAGHDTIAMKLLLKDIGRLEHNNGRIVDKFGQLDSC
jgi:atypical dual specificity phosphatase